MPALFPRWTNTFFRAALAALIALPGLAIAGLMVYVRSPYNTGQGTPVEQPVPFDHRHHTGDEGIDCRYCHTTVESSAYAGVPATSVCLNCHAQLWNKSPLLEPVRQGYFSDRPIPWRRVHDLPDFVFFNHAIHVGKGVGCVTCHGRVDQMAAVLQQSPLTMAWCLECHRDPAPHLRPLERITDMAWEPPEPERLGGELMRLYSVHARTSCTTCHR